jgi:hypothetical protein
VLVCKKKELVCLVKVFFRRAKICTKFAGPAKKVQLFR